jgi:pyrophosphatase PpaX
MHYRAVLFDFDGTLTPSLPLWVKAFHIALSQYGIEFTDEIVVKRFFYRDWADVASELQLGSVERFVDSMHRGLREAFHEAELFPEVLSILRRCRQQGRQVALVTSAPRLIIDDVMPRLHLHELFDHIVCADDVKNFKPHPEPVLMTLAALQRAPHEAIMIGDSTADILAGKAAGTATALFMPDDHAEFHHTETLRATKPDHIFENHGELPDIIGLPV